MKKGNKKGFSLIELMVVIAIIGILATGAIGVYTSQMAKARDTTRINDFSTLKAAIEQYYQDGVYQYPLPANFKKSTANPPVKSVSDYLQKLPEDPKAGTTCHPATTGNTKSACEIVYVVDTANNSAEQGAYELSIGFENRDNILNKATNVKDGGNDEARYEFFNDKALDSSMVTAKATVQDVAANDKKGIIRKDGAKK